MTDRPAMALDDVTVLDLTTYVPGPYASMVLADLGATVLHVESPAGDPARGLPDRIGEDSALHWWLSRGQGSITLDLKTPHGRDRFHRELAGADVVLEGFVPGTAARLGVDYASCRAVKADVVYCSISGYGQRAAEAGQPGHDINFAARAGLLDQTRGRDGQPVPIGPPLVDLSGSLHAAVAVLAALRHRDRTGHGQYLDVSLFGCAIASTGPQLMKALAGTPPTPESDLNLGADPAYRVYATRDGGHVAVGAIEEKFWTGLCRLLDRPDLVSERTRDPRRVATELAAIFASQDRVHWRSLLESAGVCVTVVNSIESVLADPWVRGNRAVVPADHPSGYGPTLAGPIRMSVTPPRLTERAKQAGAERRLAG